MSDLVIFDVDGTLVDSTYLHAFAWSRAFAEAGLSLPTWRVHRAIGMGGDKLVAALLGDAIEDRQGDDLRAAWQRQYERIHDELQPLPGAADLVRHVRELGLAVALASSGEGKYVDQAVELLGIADAVDVVTTNSDVEASKPDPDLLRVTLREAGAQRAVMVGDSTYDVEAAARIGLATVCVCTGGFGVAELREAGAAEVVDEPADAVGLDWPALLRPVHLDPKRS